MILEASLLKRVMNKWQDVFLFASLASVMLIVTTSCSHPSKQLFGKKTPHEAYASKLSDAGLDKTAMGKAWLMAAQNALQHPVNITLPYKETGYFAADQPFAAGYHFTARRGEMIEMAIAMDSLNSLLLFADFWRADSAKPVFLKSSDTTDLNIRYEVNETGDYGIRIQPELLKSGSYTVTIASTGSLAFPVPAQNNPRIGSFWGASRDAGARQHEGIDIFGPFRTPVVAAADGYISSTRPNNLGGKIIFLRPTSKNYSLYYAHLDSLMVKEGQPVKTGDIIGLMGNTGNAKNTPTHLHFGIYSNQGAIDPLPFVDHSQSTPKSITTSLQPLGKYIRTSRATSVLSTPDFKAPVIEQAPRSTAMKALAATAGWYRVLLPDGKQGFVNDQDVTILQSQVQTITTSSPTLLRENAYDTALPKKKLSAGMSLPVYGTYNSFYLVEAEGIKGWIKKS